jgi:peroxiredoxin
MFGNPLEGKAAPDFTLSTLTKNSVKLSEYRQGQPAIIFFWATWCPHCREALEVLDARAFEIEKQGIKVVLVDVGEDKGDVASYLKAHNIKADVFLDEDTSVSNDYSILGVPTFFLVTQEGMIKAVQHTFPEDYQEIFRVPR